MLSAPTAISSGRPGRLLLVGLGLLLAGTAATAAQAALSGLADLANAGASLVAVRGILGFGAVQLVAWEWIVAGLGLMSRANGRTVLAGYRATLAEENARTQPNNLTIAGLVFAGLAITMSATPSSSNLLIVALIAFLIAWAVLFVPSGVATTFASDAMHWLGLELLVAWVYLIALMRDAATLTAAATGLAVVLVMSTAHVAGYLRAVRKP